MALGELVANGEPRDDEGNDQRDEAEPGNSATSSALAILEDERGQILVRLGLEVAVVGLGGLEGMQQQTREPERTPPRVALYAARGPAVVVLDESGIDAQFGEDPGVPAFQKEPALVAKHFRLEDEEVGDARLDDIHAIAACPSSRPMRYSP